MDRKLMGLSRTGPGLPKRPEKRAFPEKTGPWSAGGDPCSAGPFHPEQPPESGFRSAIRETGGSPGSLKVPYSGELLSEG